MSFLSDYPKDYIEERFGGIVKAKTALRESTMGGLKYPIENRGAYQSTITFQSMTTKDYINDIKMIAKPLDNVVDSFSNRFMNKNDKSIDRIAENRKKSNSVEEKAEEARTNLIDLAKGVEYFPNQNKPKVTLYSPISLVFNDAVGYSPADLGIIGGAVEGGIQSGESIVGAVGQGLSRTGSTISQFLGAFTSGDYLQTGAAVAASRVPGAVGNAIRLTLRVTANPNTRAVFQNVNLRTFSFTFKLIPNSLEESQEIEKIVKHFRREIYPELTEQGLGYKFPDAFRISLHHKNKQVKMPKINTCFLQSVNHNYNPTAGTFHKDGYPSEVDLTMNFIEMRPLSKEDVDKNY